MLFVENEKPGTWIEPGSIEFLLIFLDLPTKTPHHIRTSSHGIASVFIYGGLI